MAVSKQGRSLPKGIRQRGQSYEGRVYYEYREYVVRGKTITETQKKRRELKYKLEHGLYVERDKILVRDWFSTWMQEYKKNQVKIGTYINYQKYYDGLINKEIGSKKLNSIRGEHIQKMYNEWVKEGYSLSTIKIASAVLNGCFKQAERNGLIERNPVKLAVLPRIKDAERNRVMTREQQNLFMKYARESYLYNFFAVLLRTGMRSGELRALIYSSDVDINAGVIHVRRTLKYENRQEYKIPEEMRVKSSKKDTYETNYFVDTPKTSTSIRDIPMTKETEFFLNAQKNYWRFQVERVDRFLFCTENGEPLSRWRVQGEIDRIVKRIRKDGHEFPHITSHVFRHTFATRAIEEGMQPQILKAILGHSSLAMTMDLYSHVLPDVKAEEMDKIAGGF